MPAVLGWKVWYGPTHCVAGPDWEAVPDDGVQCVVIYFEKRDGQGHPTRLMLSGDDHYFLAPGLDHPVCNNDPVAEIHRRFPGAVIKRGQWTSYARFTETTTAALADREAP